LRRNEMGRGVDAARLLSVVPVPSQIRFALEGLTGNPAGAEVFEHRQAGGSRANDAVLLGVVQVHAESALKALENADYFRKLFLGRMRPTVVTGVCTNDHAREAPCLGAGEPGYAEAEDVGKSLLP